MYWSYIKDKVPQAIWTIVWIHKKKFTFNLSDDTYSETAQEACEQISVSYEVSHIFAADKKTLSVDYTAW